MHPKWISPTLKVAGLGGAAGVAGLGYAAGVEVRSFALRRVEIPCLPQGRRPLRVLHVSDLHMTPTQGRKQRWLRSLAGLAPDLVIDTGDNLAHLGSVPVVLDAFGPLLDVPGVFVLGSNDYYAPKPYNPLRYLLPDTGRRNTNAPTLPVEELRSAFTGHGWVDLTNTTRRLEVGGTSLAFAGVDDPHLGLDDLSAVAGPAPDDADVRIGVAHAPYLRVLD
ncbi:MAG: metallophosphoesterase, partial [Marmoricola sp.]